MWALPALHGVIGLCPLHLRDLIDINHTDDGCPHLSYERNGATLMVTPEVGPIGRFGVVIFHVCGRVTIHAKQSSRQAAELIAKFA
jgi:hypothetical protein